MRKIGFLMLSALSFLGCTINYVDVDPISLEFSLTEYPELIGKTVTISHEYTFHQTETVNAYDYVLREANSMVWNMEIMNMEYNEDLNEGQFQFDLLFIEDGEMTNRNTIFVAISHGKEVHDLSTERPVILRYRDYYIPATLKITYSFGAVY